MITPTTTWGTPEPPSDPGDSLILDAVSRSGASDDAEASLFHFEDENLKAALTNDDAAEGQPVRLIANISASDAEVLTSLAQQAGYNRATTLVRAIRVFASLAEAEDAGGTITVTYPDGRRERVLVR
jgi:hypothetical protein